MSESDPGAALPSRVQDWLFRCAGLPWNGAETTALICDLASALQQTQAENLKLKEELDLARISYWSEPLRRIRELEAENQRLKGVTS